MLGHFGFSYVGLIFLILLMIPNLLWINRKPQGYTAEKENVILLWLERIGEVSVCISSLIFSDYNLRSWTAWSWWLIAAFLLMVMYEFWWLRYFRSERKLADFYSDLFIIPVAGATLPVAAFFMLGIYGRVGIMLIAVSILGIGHIGIHIQHRKELDHAANQLEHCHRHL